MNDRITTELWQQLWQGLRNALSPPPPLILSGRQALVSAYPVSELATSSVALAAQAVASLTGNDQPLRIDCALASRWFQHALRPIPPPEWCTATESMSSLPG